MARSISRAEIVKGRPDLGFVCFVSQCRFLCNLTFVFLVYVAFCSLCLVVSILSTLIGLQVVSTSAIHCLEQWKDLQFLNNRLPESGVISQPITHTVTQLNLIRDPQLLPRKSNIWIWRQCFNNLQLTGFGDNVLMIYD